MGARVAANAAHIRPCSAVRARERAEDKKIALAFHYIELWSRRIYVCKEAAVVFIYAFEQLIINGKELSHDARLESERLDRAKRSAAQLLSCLKIDFANRSVAVPSSLEKKQFPVLSGRQCLCFRNT